MGLSLHSMQLSYVQPEKTSCYDSVMRLPVGMPAKVGAF